MDEVAFSCSEVSAVSEVLQIHARPDFRRPTELRPFKIEFAEGSAIVRWGRTLVSCSTTFEEVQPHEDRPSEGMHVLTISSTRKLGQLVHGEMLDSIRNCLHKSRALDLEGLVIRIGELVFCLRSELVVQSNDGGLIEAMQVALVVSLMSLKLPSPRGTRPVVLHHLPLAVSFGYMDTGFYFVDPTALEEVALSGVMTVFANAQGELCGVHKNGGVGLRLRIMQQAEDLALDLVKVIHSEVMAQMGAAAPQNLRAFGEQRKKVEEPPATLEEMQKQIVAEMRGDDVPSEDDEENEPLDPALLALFQ